MSGRRVVPREMRYAAGDESCRGRQDVPRETRHTVEGGSEAEGTVKQSGVRGFPLQQPDSSKLEEEMLPRAKGILGDSPGPWASTPESLPDSLFDIKCCCGLEGDGNIFYNEEEGEAIQCNDCMQWSHIACQTNGWASKLWSKEHFFCDFCSISVAKAGYLDKYWITKQRYEVHHRLLYKINNQLELAGSWSHAQVVKNNSRIILCMWPFESHFIFPHYPSIRFGRGALVHHGDFWYPAHIIQYDIASKQWCVHWCRECSYAIEGIKAGSITLIDKADVVDSLWGDAHAQRQIRVCPLTIRPQNSYQVVNS